jgi:hypothetical protein
MGRWFWVAGLVLLAGASLNAKDAPADRLTKEVRQADQTVQRWLDGLHDKTLEEIRASLGTPTKEADWEFKGKKQPLLTYQIGATGKLSVYFYMGRVVKASYLLLSR